MIAYSPDRSQRQHARTADDVGHLGAQRDAGAPLLATLITADGSFAALEREWDELLDATRNASVFQSWEWAYSWWETFREKKELRIIALRDADQRLVGLWPLYLRRVQVMRGLRATEVRLLGTGQEVSPEYMGPLATPEAEPHVAPALLDWLTSAKEWDTARLTDVRSDAWWLPAVADGLRESGMHAAEEPRARCSYAELPSTFDEYLMGLGKNVRGDVRRRTRLIERDHSPEFYRWGSEPAEDGIEEIAALYSRRRAQTGDSSGAFSTPGYISFHRLLGSRLQARGWLDLYGLRVGGSVVSVLYGMTYRGVLNVYQTGFDPSWARHGVGTILRSYVLEDAIRRGLSEADFLKGEYDYKGRWTNAERRTVSLDANNASAMGSLEYVHRNVGQQIRQVARHYLPAPIFRLARRAHGSLKHWKARAS